MVRCFFDMEMDGLSLGRLVFELFDDICPITCENFRCLCTGEKGTGSLTGKLLHYEGSPMHRVVKGFMIQGGDFSASNGKGGESIYGGTFDDENFELKHDDQFLLSMANKGPNTNGSQFFITTQPAPHLDGIHVVFGRVIHGHDVVTMIENVPVNSKSRPLQNICVSRCGQLVLKSKKDKNKSTDLHSKKKKTKKARHERPDGHSEEGECSDDLEDGVSDTRLKSNIQAVGEDSGHSVSVTKSGIDLSDIPDVPANRFLQRISGCPTSAHKPDSWTRPTEEMLNSDWRVRSQMIDKYRRSFHRTSYSYINGKKVKGRGFMRYSSGSSYRSRSVTPPHWRQAQNKLISFSDYTKKKTVLSQDTTENNKRNRDYRQPNSSQDEQNKILESIKISRETNRLLKERKHRSRSKDKERRRHRSRSKDKGRRHDRKYSNIKTRRRDRSSSNDSRVSSRGASMHSDKQSSLPASPRIAKDLHDQLDYEEDVEMQGNKHEENDLKRGKIAARHSSSSRDKNVQISKNRNKEHISHYEHGALRKRQVKDGKHSPSGIHFQESPKREIIHKSSAGVNRRRHSSESSSCSSLSSREAGRYRDRRMNKHSDNKHCSDDKKWHSRREVSHSKSSERCHSDSVDSFHGKSKEDFNVSNKEHRHGNSKNSYHSNIKKGHNTNSIERDRVDKERHDIICRENDDSFYNKDNERRYGNIKKNRRSSSVDRFYSSNRESHREVHRRNVKERYSDRGDYRHERDKERYHNRRRRRVSSSSSMTSSSSTSKSGHVTKVHN